MNCNQCYRTKMPVIDYRAFTGEFASASAVACAIAARMRTKRPGDGARSHGSASDKSRLAIKEYLCWGLDGLQQRSRYSLKQMRIKNIITSLTTMQDNQNGFE